VALKEVLINYDSVFSKEYNDYEVEISEFMESELAELVKLIVNDESISEVVKVRFKVVFE
jgi:hypothetical protein